MVRVTDFDSAIVRTPSRSVVNGLRNDASAVPSYEDICAEHAAYVAALKQAGLAVDILPPLEAFPDSVFVEDPALVFPDAAILLAPGAASRFGERDDLRRVLRRHFERVFELGDGEHVDGGDILVTPHLVFIGLSARTNVAGADALELKLASLGRRARIVETPPAILHFKTASSLLDEETIFATPAMAASGVFDGFHVVLTPEGEAAAANALRVNDAVFAAAGFPRTLDLLSGEGYRVIALDVSETAKLDAGLSCMSLRWRAR
ncbi:MAG: arginine deiminase family protein [Rhizomicrobium sp.]|jgi:dimethylargininase